MLQDIPKFSSRRFELILYLEKEEIKSICDKEKNIEYYAFNIHDKDLNQDGSPKEPHVHLILSTKYPYQSTTIYNKFKIDERNVRIINVVDLQSRLQYLIHKKDKDKFQYDINEVVTNNFEWRRKIEKEDIDFEFDKTSQAVMDLARGVPYKEMIMRYGHNFIIHFNTISLLANEIRLQVLMDDLEEAGIDLDKI